MLLKVLLPCVLALLAAAQLTLTLPGFADQPFNAQALGTGPNAEVTYKVAAPTTVYPENSGPTGLTFTLVQGPSTLSFALELPGIERVDAQCSIGSDEAVCIRSIDDLSPDDLESDNTFSSRVTTTVPLSLLAQQGIVATPTTFADSPAATSFGDAGALSDNGPTASSTSPGKETQGADQSSLAHRVPLLEGLALIAGLVACVIVA